MLAELSIASWQTMAYRTGMMMLDTCSGAEYQKMLSEKIQAAQESALAAMTPSDDPFSAALAPWLRAASANAKRLSRPKRRR